MKKVFLCSVIAGAAMILALNAQSLDKGLEQIILFKVTDTMAVSTPLTGVGLNGFKLAVGEEMILLAKGVNIEGQEVPIWPTWKADKELSLMVVEGRSRTVVIKAVKAGAPLFVTAVYITDDGKKIKSEAMGSVK